MEETGPEGAGNGHAARCREITGISVSDIIKTNRWKMGENPTFSCKNREAEMLPKNGNKWKIETLKYGNKWKSREKTDYN